MLNDNSTTLLSLAVPPTGNHAESTILLLKVPHDCFPLYSTKPRKWLHYAAYAITGRNGTLRFLGQDGDINLEEDVSPADHFVYILPQGPVQFTDLDLRIRRYMCNSSASRDSVSGDMRDFYQGCPFSKYAPFLCNACHLVPRLKGTDYLCTLLKGRGDTEDLDIDDPQNMLVLNADLHAAFHVQYISFLKTPNVALKSNELPGKQASNPESYQITLQWFYNAEEPGYGLFHGETTDLSKGSGNLVPPPHAPSSAAGTNENFRPRDVIFDLIYGYCLLLWWGADAGKEFIKDSNKGIFPAAPPVPDTVQTEEGTGEELNSASDDGDGDLRLDPENDMLDFMLLLSYRIRGTTPQEVAEQQRKNAEATKKSKMEHLNAWRQEVRDAPSEDSAPK